MDALVDTHTFLWYVDDDPQLSRIARSYLNDANNVCYISVVSAREIAVKVSISKLRLTQDVFNFFEDAMKENGFRLLEVKLKHTQPVETLPLHHRDPFDRMLISQSIVENMAIVSADAVFDSYEGVTRFW